MSDVARPVAPQHRRAGAARRGGARWALIACAVAGAGCAPAAGERPRAGADSLVAEPVINPALPSPSRRDPLADVGRTAGLGAMEFRGTGCRVLAPTAEHGRIAIAACERAGAEVARVLGAPAPRGLVVVAGLAGREAPDALRRADERWVLPIHMYEASDELQIGDGRKLSPAGYVTHEAAHRIATALLFPADTGAPTPGRYGSALPDWLDEGVALLAEPTADQDARLGLLFDGETIYALPLRRFLYMAHPALSGLPAGGPVRRTFYGQALAFSLFVQERGGPDALRGLTERLRAGVSQGVALTSTRGLPADGGALEQAWLAWLRGRRATLRAAGQGGEGAR